MPRLGRSAVLHAAVLCGVLCSVTSLSPLSSDPARPPAPTAGASLLQVLPELLPAAPVCDLPLQSLLSNSRSPHSSAFLEHVCDGQRRLRDRLRAVDLAEEPELESPRETESRWVSGADLHTLTLEDEEEQTEGLREQRQDVLEDELPEWAYDAAAWLAPMQSSVKNELCRQQSRAYLEQLNEAAGWALKMFDSSGKLPDGFFYGNNNMLGSFDECLRVTSELNETTYPNITETSFKGKYCLANIVATFNQDESGDVDLGLVPFLPVPFVNKVVGSMTTAFPLRYGYCVPSSCTEEDVMMSLNEWLFSRNGTSLSIYDAYCQTDDEETTLETNDIVVIVLLAIFGAIIALCTTLDVIGVYKSRAAGSSTDQALIGPSSAFPPADWRIVKAFSLRYNGNKLFSTRTNPDNLTCLHGMRFFSLTWVVLGHNYIFALGAGAWNNTSYIAELVKAPALEAVMNGLLSVDTFFLLGGMMVSYSFMKSLAASGGRFSWLSVPMMYLHRFLRLTPVYAIVLAITATVLRRIGTGPGLLPVLEAQAEACQISWWRNLLYINNYFDVSESCIGQSWYLTVDFQLFLVAPFMIIPFVYNKKIGAVWLGLLTAASVAIPAVVTYTEDLPPTSLFLNVMAAEKQDELFTDFYIVPWCRASPYIIGIIMGLILHHIKANKINIRIPTVINLATWAVMAAVALTIVYSTHQWNKDMYATYTTAEAVSYGSLHRLAWAIAISWVVFACVTDHGGFVNTLLSFKGFIPLGRLSFATYLVAIQVQVWYFASYRIPQTLGNTIMAYTFLSNLIVSIAVAVVLYLCFESPMMTIEKIIFPQKQRKTGPKQGVDNPIAQETPLEASTRL